MSRTFVRQTVYTYITTPMVSGVDYVFPGVPFDQAGVPWDSIIMPGQTHRCFLVIEIGQSDDFGDHIFIFDGAGGRRVLPYPVTMSVYFEDIGGDPLAALTAQEGILDALAARMRADPDLGTVGTSELVVAATPHLTVVPGVLERQGEGDTFASWSAIEFPVSVYEFST